ncbi:MAG TPA: DUF3261 domain-containing protein [Kofleriaceae bacterium]|jgi:hypothetical protein|nr:DUF3261 domain-containing protein [Kofleriaceae bacterium]
MTARTLTAFAVLAALVAGCGAPSRHVVLPASSAADYPCVLHDPATLPHDFLVRQSLRVHARRDGQPVDGQFDAILQKQGDTLLIVGFGPMNVKAFTLEQRGDRIEFTQFYGPALPFSPRNVVVDVHRVFFKRLPPPAPGFAGAVRGELDGETVEETWQAGELRRAVFTRPGSALRGAVTVELGPGCTPAACEPASATLRNDWFDYTLEITNEGYERL